MINAVGGLGGFLGTYLVGALGGGTGAAFVFLAACLLVAALPMFLARRPHRAAPEPSPPAGAGLPAAAGRAEA